MQVWRLNEAGRNESVLRTLRDRHRSLGMQKTSGFRIGWARQRTWRKFWRLGWSIRMGFLHRVDSITQGS